MSAPGTTNAPAIILAFGDSLTAGYGLRANETYPALLEARLKRDGVAARVVNAGVSGDTTTDGLRRLAWSLPEDPRERPTAAILELGANDGLRGEDPARVEANLEALLSAFKAKGVPVLFTGMYAMANLGPGYTEAFNGIFPRLAQKHGVLFYPFFLEGVAGDAGLNLPDGLHPNAKGTARIVEQLYPYVLELLKKAGR